MPELREEDINLRSEEVQEILAHVPNWLIRWGITFIFIIVLLLLAGAWYIKYPEIITSKVSVVTENPPLRLVAQASGKIRLNVPDKGAVKKDQYVALIENTANTADVLALKNMLINNLHYVNDNIDALHLGFERSMELGDLQNDYAALKQNYQNYTFFKADNYYRDKIAAIKNQYGQYKVLNEKVTSQKELLTNDLGLAEKKYNNDKTLFKQGVIAEADLSRSEAEYIQKRYSYKNAEISLVNNEIQLDEYQKTIMDLQQQFLEKKRQYVLSLQESFKKTLSSIASWEQHYVLKTNIDGNVSYAKPFADGQYVSAGEEVLTVVPGANNIVAKVYIPSFGSGKVAPGQRVNIKLDSYPFKEFGIIEGRVESVSLVASNSLYLVNVTLPKGMTTNYHKPLEFKQEMSGTAEIITKDLRLLERVFNQLRSVIKRST